jgi:WhiB family redox-sensing transcriptional regulator
MTEMPQQPLAQVPKDAQWHWQEHGACREADPLLFFHPQNERGTSRMRRDRAAKLVCASCDVRMECADYAVRAREPYGVWGGLSEDDREHIYSRLDSRHYPRQRGEGLRVAGEEIAEAVSPRALGIA